MATPALGRDQLAESLRALGHENRLDLLEALRTPRALPEIRLAPRRVLPGENPDRAMSRQAVQDHLEKLLEVRLAVEVEAPDRRARSFALNRPRLYQVLEELRAVATALPGGVAPGDDTVDLAEPHAARPDPGPRLVVVHGLAPGKAFPLQRGDLLGERGWIVGRKKGLHVSLDYDPYVSVENSEVLPHEGGFLLADAPGSKNGTRLNWRRLSPHERAPLRPGDVVGVGRSLLVFQQD